MQKKKNGFEWRKTKGLFVINKNGVYFSLDKDELARLKATIRDIEIGGNALYQEDNR